LCLSLRNRTIPRARWLHHSETPESRVLGQSIARKSQNPTRGKAPSLRKCRIPRAGTVHRSETAESHAQEESIAQKLQNSTRGSHLLSINGRIKLKSTN